MSDRMDEIRSTRAPVLRTDQIRILKRYGKTRETEVGDVLFRAGDTENDFVVVLEGEVKVGDDFPGEWRTIGTFHEGRFLGELNMLTGQAMYLTGVVSEAGEVLTMPRERLKEVVTEEPNLSDIILRAFLARRSYMVRTGLGLRIIGSRHSGDAARLREFAARNRVPHGGSSSARSDSRSPAREVRREAVGCAGDRLAGRGRAQEADQGRVRPRHGPRSRRPLGANLRPRGGGCGTRGPRRVGLRGIGGPSTLALESIALGGQAGTSSRIENYPGFPAGLPASSSPAASSCRPTSSAPAPPFPRRR